MSPHLLQTPPWGELKSRFGWTPCRIERRGALAQVLFRRLPLGRSIAYIPKGPAVEWSDLAQSWALLSAIHAEATKRRAIFLKIEPDLSCTGCDPFAAFPTAFAPADSFLRGAGFLPSNTIQPQATIVVDIRGDEGIILGGMKQKTRYNIRLAGKKGVTVRQGDAGDLETFYTLARATTARDGFAIHSIDYYQAGYNLFAPEQCALLIAEFEGTPLAALLAFCQGERAYYLYGASANESRSLMPTYLLQWAAITWAKSRGCAWYDLWGIPYAPPKRLETEFQTRSDGLWGVYRFKRGFGGQLVYSPGAYDYVYNSSLYRLYRLLRLRAGTKI
jgi:lipid II:glycine glycyltransferase (peptidoglycan interpeptide bridge formation enzyme)